MSTVPLEEASNSLCFLCGGGSVHMTLFSNFTDEERKFIIHHSEAVPPSDGLICKKHWVEAKRHYNNTSYKPIWGKNITNHESVKRCYPSCSTDA